ncbi:MAG TPA: tetratricopeptide repeat protein [Vicinamibacteria bacterium]|nr:tetratricopeptide repeat protein [Vicinamibacteria bacterium]
MTFVKEITDDEFETEVVQRSREVPVLVDFWAAWCGPCRVLGPTLERLANEGNGRFVLAKIDVDRFPRHAQAFGVRGIPTVIAFRDGKLVGEFSGALPEEGVREFLKKVLPSAADDLAARAEDLRSTDPAAAEALYREALASEADHAGAAVGLAEILAGKGETAEAARLVNRIPASGSLSDRIAQLQSELAFSEQKPQIPESELRKRITESPRPGPLLVELGKLLAAEKRFPEALEVLFQAAQSNRTLAEGEAKELMVSIFHAIGVRSPLADEYRTKLTRLLY